MLAFRLLNDIDVLIDPEKNGIVSKKTLFDIVYRSLENNKKFLLLSKNEQNDFVQKNIELYVKNHERKLEKKFLACAKKMYDVTRAIANFELQFDGADLGISSEKYTEALIKYGYILSTLNNHLANGSRVTTNWISGSNNFASIYNYFLRQKNPNVAIIRYQIPCNGAVDFPSGTIVVDASNKGSVLNSKSLFNKVSDSEYHKILQDLDFDRLTSTLKRTHLNSRPINYARSSSEVCFYDYIRKEMILGVLGQLEIDLLLRQKYTFIQNKNVRKEELSKFMYLLRIMLIGLNDSYILHVFDELYVQNKGINYTDFSVLERQKVEHYRTKILTLANNIPSSIIKKQ